MFRETLMSYLLKAAWQTTLLDLLVERQCRLPWKLGTSPGKMMDDWDENMNSSHLAAHLLQSAKCPSQVKILFRNILFDPFHSSSLCQPFSRLPSAASVTFMWIPAQQLSKRSAGAQRSYSGKGFELSSPRCRKPG